MRNRMQDRENEFAANDLALILFIVVAGWLLLFHSGLV
jgi:hypothetical protein